MTDISLHLRAEAKACERAADAHAREACALAGRAAFRRRQGDLAFAAELEARLHLEERREARALALARAHRRRALRLEARDQAAFAIRAVLAPTPSSRPEVCVAARRAGTAVKPFRLRGPG